MLWKGFISIQLEGAESNKTKNSFLFNLADFAAPFGTPCNLLKLLQFPLWEHLRYVRLVLPPIGQAESNLLLIDAQEMPDQTNYSQSTFGHLSTWLLMRRP